MYKNSIVFILIFCLTLSLSAQDLRWNIADDKSIVWQVDERIPHYDHIEMSGEQVSTVLRYGVREDGSLKMEMSLVWPLLRKIPNNTHGSLMQKYTTDYPASFTVDGKLFSREKVKSISLDGRLTALSEFYIGNEQKPSVEIVQRYFPSTTLPVLCHRIIVKNITNKEMMLSVPMQKRVYKSPNEQGVDGIYTQILSIHNGGVYTLKAGESATIEASVGAYKEGQAQDEIDNGVEEQKREAFVRQMWDNLVFTSPDEVINTMFAFAKIRAAESIFKTKGGYMHGPGGEAYYAAIWANDQAEYVNPLFPFMGYRTANLSAINSFRHFARFMNTDYRPIPSSIIAEGDDIWHGAGDRGDGAMIAYGAARYALERADRAEAAELWSLIEWCLEFCKRKITKDGVVASDSDELEGRFPAGQANLSTSSLYYDALISASYLAKELGKPKTYAKRYLQEAAVLRKNIEKYFGSNVEGFETYRYYDGNTVLRSWICVPLTVGINERKEGSIQALFSPRLWTKNGLLTQAGTETFWDRSTLYALRGVYSAGESDTATAYLKHYSTERLLGDHVPYAIEAWPEGSQRHLSAESGLYCRVITEGMFGFRPTGFRSFTLNPQLPEGWDNISLKNVWACSDSPYDIEVLRTTKNKLKIIISGVGKPTKTYSSIAGKEVVVTF